MPTSCLSCSAVLFSFTYTQYQHTQHNHNHFSALLVRTSEIEASKFIEAFESFVVNLPLFPIRVFKIFSGYSTMFPSSATANGAFAPEVPIPAGQWLPGFQTLADAAGHLTPNYAAAPAQSDFIAPRALSQESMAPLHGSGRIGAGFSPQLPPPVATQQVGSLCLSLLTIQCCIKFCCELSYDCQQIVAKDI
jgi:hypothetical protein